MPGTDTLAAEVTQVSKHGLGLLLGEEELLLPFSEFPWFRQATIDRLTTLEWPSPDPLYLYRLEAYGDIELFGLFPRQWWGRHSRPWPDRKPYG